ncbi:MAG: cation:proton antiporter [Flavobacteriales bacterium]
MLDRLEELRSFLFTHKLPLLLVLGVMILLAYLASRPIKKLGLPAILAYLLVGVILGPSVTGILGEELLRGMDFVIQGCLAFIAFKIGLEIDLKEVRRKGRGLAITTLSESFMAALLVGFGVWVVSGQLAMGLAMGALAPASAPAGTVAVIEEYGARGKLTELLYSVVGIDDGLGIVLFGLITPFAILSVGGEALSVEGGAGIFLHSLEEILISIGLGLLFAWGLILVNKERMDDLRVFLLSFAFILLLSGIAQLTGGSLILANMLFGVGVGQWGTGRLRELEEKDLGVVLPFFFLLFFTIAGANLHIEKMGEAGFLAAAYILLRGLGLYLGAYVGTSISGFESKIRKNLGLGILSQAGVAIGLALIVQQKLKGLGPVISEGVTRGDLIGDTLFTTITVTSIFFEFFGPILAKYGLKRAGEIEEHSA